MCKTLKELREAASGVLDQYDEEDARGTTAEDVGAVQEYVTALEELLLPGGEFVTLQITKETMDFWLSEGLIRITMAVEVDSEDTDGEG